MNKTFLTVLIMALALIAVGCGSGGGKTPVTVGGQHLVDPSGNWKMSSWTPMPMTCSFCLGCSASPALS
jgi:hypothetical protein